MIPTTLHLLACIALAAASLYGRYHDPAGDTAYRRMLPFIIAPGLPGLLIFYGYFMEFFVASYSGAIYEVGVPTRRQIAWIAVSVILTLLPLAGLIPSVGRKALFLLVLACLAAVPGVVSIISHTPNQDAEQGGGGEPAGPSRQAGD